MLFLNQYVTGFGGWSLVETCMAVWMESFYWHRRAALIAEVCPEVHPIHRVQSTYGFWTFKPVYIHISEVFQPVSCSLWQSDHCWFFYYHYINKNSFQKENLHYEIVAFLCYTWSNFLNFSWQDMHNSLFFLEKKEWFLISFHSFREMKSDFFPFTHFESEKWNENALKSRSRVKSEMKMPQDRDREVK